MAANRLSGAEIEELKELATTHFWPHSASAGDMSEETGIKLVTSAEGVWVEDVHGKRWFDTLAGMWLKNIGHGRKEITEAVYQQMLDVSYTPGGTVSPATVRLAAKVASLSPDADSRVYFVSGGSEAVETALKMAKRYHQVNGEPARYKVISRRNSYHGATHACISLGGGGNRPPWPNDYGPLMPGNIHVAQPGSYRCNFCRERGRVHPRVRLRRGACHRTCRGIHRGGVHWRAHFCCCGNPHPPSAVLAHHSGDMRQARRGDDMRRGHHWVRTHGQDVCHRALGSQARHLHRRQGADQRVLAHRRRRRQQEDRRRIRRGRFQDFSRPHHFRWEPCLLRRGAGQPGNHGERGNGVELGRVGPVPLRTYADAV